MNGIITSNMYRLSQTVADSFRLSDVTQRCESAMNRLFRLSARRPVRRAVGALLLQQLQPKHSCGVRAHATPDSLQAAATHVYTGALVNTPPALYVLPVAALIRSTCQVRRRTGVSIRGSLPTERELSISDFSTRQGRR